MDGLRAVAVLLVLTYHLEPAWAPGGLLGVDVFFVISGFVVTASLSGLSFNGLGELASYFYVRRVRRVLPALLLLLFAATLLTCLFMPWVWIWPATARTAVAAAFGAGNLVLLVSGAEYGGPPLRFTPFVHTWSLGVEEQFYLLFPFIISWWRRCGGGAKGYALVGGFSLVSFGLALLCAPYFPQLSFYLMPTRFWELGMGMVLCLSCAAWQPLLARQGPLSGLCITASATLLLGWASFRQDAPGAVSLQLCAVAAAALLIVLICSQPRGGTARVLSAHPFLYVGRISYSLYLWHLPVFVLSRWTFGLDSLSSKAAALAASVAAGALSYHFIEQRFRASSQAPQRSQRSILVAGGAGVILVAAFVALLAKPTTPLTLTTYPYPTGSSIPAAAGPCVAAARSALGRGTVVTWMPQCRRSIRGRRLVVLGDSHAQSYQTMLARYAADTPSPVRLYYKAGCEFPVLQRPTQQESPCRRWYADAMAEITRSLRDGDVLFLTSLHVPLLSPRWDRVDDALIAPSDAEYRAAFSEARAQMEMLARVGVRIILEAPKPIFRSPPFRCSDWFNRRNPVCRPGFIVSRGEELRWRANAMRAIQRLAVGLPGVAIWDPFPILCPGDPCHAFRGDRAAFHDDNHLNPYGASLLYEAFVAAVARETVASD